MAFGYVELAEAGKLLTTFKTHHDKTELLGSNVAIEFNPSSGFVFLVDDEYHVAVMAGHELHDFYSCPECGNEGLDGDDYEFRAHEGYCSHECADKNK